MVFETATHQKNLPNRQSQIPKILIQYWHDSRILPEDVNSCVQSWDTWVEENHVTRIMFYDISARAFISKHFDGNLAV